MNTISINYPLLWRIDFAENYQFTKCKKLFNVKTGKQLKQVYNNGSLGYCINSKFYSFNKLRKHLVKIVLNDCPF